MDGCVKPSTAVHVHTVLTAVDPIPPTTSIFEKFSDTAEQLDYRRTGLVSCIYVFGQDWTLLVVAYVWHTIWYSKTTV